MKSKGWIVIVLAAPTAIKSLWELGAMALNAAGGVGMQPDVSRILDIIFNIMALIGIGGLVRYWALEAVRKAVVTVPEANEKLKAATAKYDAAVEAVRQQTEATACENLDAHNRLQQSISDARGELGDFRVRLQKAGLVPQGGDDLGIKKQVS